MKRQSPSGQQSLQLLAYSLRFLESPSAYSNNIQASVPALLGGLQTAFWASVAGVGGALLLKFRHQYFDRSVAEGTGENGEVTGADLARLLSGIQTALVGERRDIADYSNQANALGHQ